MGKVKQLFMESWEEKLLADEKRFTSSSGSPKKPKQLELFPDDQAQAQYEAEFNAWLDAYEKSFGDGDGDFSQKDQTSGEKT